MLKPQEKRADTSTSSSATSILEFSPSNRRRATSEKAEQIESLDSEEQSLFQEIWSRLKSLVPEHVDVRLPALVQVLGQRAITAVTNDLQRVQMRRQPIAM